MKSTHDGVPVVVDNFEYPLFINVTYLEASETYMSCKFPQSHHDSQVRPTNHLLDQSLHLSIFPTTDSSFPLLSFSALISQNTS